jgi:hypothetical protein
MLNITHNNHTPIMGSLGTLVIQISGAILKASRVVTPITEHLVFQRFANFWRVLL